MRRVVLAVACLFLFPAPPVASATESDTNEVPDVEITAELSRPEIPASEKLHLTMVRIDYPAGADDPGAAQWPARGSFWWVVGAIVVAGVILSVLL